MVTTRSNTSINQNKSPRERKKKHAGEPETNGKASLNGHGASKSASTGGVAQTRELSHDEGNFLWRFWHYTLVPIALMLATPTFNVLLSYTVQRCGGSLTELVARLTENGLGNGIARVYAEVSWGSSLACGVILSYLAWAVLLMKLVPGKRVQGPVTPKGNVPVYKDNGFYCYTLTMIAFGGLTYFLYDRGLTPTIVYDHFHEFLGALTLYSHALCVFLYIKGLFFPSTSDCGSSGNPIFDYFWGTELYPRILGIDIKVLTNCRFGMTVWPLLCVIFALKSYELHGFVDSMWVSCALQLVYITKFFWWEAGYMGTIDIMMDRAGYCICWGCLAFIPGMYTSVSFFLVTHPVHLGPGLSSLILGFGLLCIAVNYLADAQKQAVRASDGRATVWGRAPSVIRAKYRLESGAVHESLLLVCGYWALARHFHYVPEIALALAWTLPALFSHALPFAYVAFLAVLLGHRTVRDDAKCRKKYGRYWAEYCQRVPYRIVPYVF